MDKHLALIANKEYQTDINQAWLSFMYSSFEKKEVVRPDIYASWQFSQKSGVKMNMSRLPAPLPMERVIKSSDALNKYRELGLQQIYAFSTLLKDSGYVGFFTDNDLMIIKQHGDDSLLEELKARNITLGAILQEDLVGTNAVAIAHRSGEQNWVIGTEHYSRVFHEYACAAVPLRDAHDRCMAFLMLISHIDNVDLLGMGVIEYFATSVEGNFKLEERNKKLLMMNKLIKLAMEQYPYSLMSLDEEGKILTINDQAHIILGLEADKVIGRPLAQVSPGFKDILNASKISSTIDWQEVFNIPTPHGKQNFRLSSHPVKNGDKIIGAVVSIQESKSIHRMVNRIASSQARFVLADLIGNNTQFIENKQIAEMASKGNSNILLLGESGTGKELFAHAIHSASKRANEAFISVNCAAIPRELIGSELFGYVEGAFTGALKGGSPGKFELANGGTIFLDEIGEMPMDMQVVLLRTLEERRVSRLGSKNSTPIDVRIIAATNRNLKKAVAEHSFRLDLYYRLNVITINMVPLRDRLDDLPLLINYFLIKYCSDLNKRIAGVAPEVMELLYQYDWPGNIRELGNVIERGVTLAKTDMLLAEDLPQDIIEAVSVKSIGLERSKQSEKDLIQELLRTCGGNKTKAARKLGISRATLYRKLQQ